MRFSIPILCLLAILPLSAQKKVDNPWEMEDSHTTASLRGIHNAGGGVAWASGTDGTVLRTEDGGYLWQTCSVPPGAAKLDFRGVWAWDAQTAVVMSSGSGDQSRLYKTTDGCGTWRLLYTNPDPKGFWDAIAFWNRDEGVILGDPVGGTFTLLRVSLSDDRVTPYGGTSFYPRADGDSAFAASNSALCLRDRVGDSHRPGEAAGIAFASGGKPGGSVYSRHASLNNDRHTANWTKTSVPLASGSDSSGVFSLAFQGHDYGVAVGGDYQKPNESSGTAAWTADGGRTWTAAARPPHGYRSSAEWDPTRRAWIAAGTNGSDVSFDGGRTWEALDDGNWNALSLPWVVGPKGRIAKLVSLKLR